MENIIGGDNNCKGIQFKSTPERGTYVPNEDDMAHKILKVLSQLNPEYLELALLFVEREEIQSIQDNELASQVTAGEQYS